MISLRKLFACFCLVAVLLAALTPVPASLLWAILVPLLFVAGAISIAWADRQPEESEIPALAYLPVVASRPPPVVDPLI
jgi:hypothetical protein